AADDDDFGVLQRRAGADALADDVAVDIREHVVEEEDVGAEALGEHAGLVAGAGGLDLEAAIADEHVADEGEDGVIIIDDEDAAGVALNERRRDVVIFHKADEFLARDAAELRARDAEA